MNEEIKTIWLEALESGEYKQGFGTLHNTDENTYCCLGVLCDLAVKAGVAKEFPHGSCESSYGFEFVEGVSRPRGSTETKYLPASVMAWAGLDRRNPTITETEEDIKKTLADYNDEGEPFVKITALIREQL